MKKIILVKDKDKDKDEIRNLVDGYNLIGIDNEDGSVNIIKNRFNEVKGKIPKTLWDMIVEDVSKMEQEKATVHEEHEQEVYDVDEMFNDIGDLFDGLFKDAKTFKTKVKPQAENIIEDLGEVFNEMFGLVAKEINSAVKERTITDEEIQIAKDRKKLVKKAQIRTNKIKDCVYVARQLGIATKGMIKKADAQIKIIQNSLD